MAPEVFMRHLSLKCDVWSAGEHGHLPACEEQSRLSRACQRS